MIIAIDFDGTIVDHEFPKIGKLKNNAKEVINELYDEGHKIIIWTCRYDEPCLFGCDVIDSLRSAVEFLRDNKIKFHKVNENINGMGFSPKPKIYADMYIDDRNIFCGEINWDVIKNHLQIRGILNPLKCGDLK